MAGAILRLAVTVGLASIAGCGSRSVELPALADSVAEAWYVDEKGELGGGGVVDPPPVAAYCQSEEICKVLLADEKISLHVDLADDGCWEAVSVVVGGGGEPIDAPFEGCVEGDEDPEAGLFRPAASEPCRTDEAEAAGSCLEFVPEEPG